MAKYKIALLPGDGVGVDVINAAKLILDTLNFDAEYEYGDIGWKFWCEEGNPLPDRTLELFERTDCTLFGAITSKPKDEAAKELCPELKGKGLEYSSPIVGLRQKLNLHTNFRPCIAFEGNPLNYKDNIDLAIFRENTEGLYSGVEFYPLPEHVYDTLCENPKMEKFKQYGLENTAVSCRIMTRQKCENIVRQAFKYADENNRRSVTVVDKPNVIRETGGLMIRTAREVAKDYPDIPLYETNIDAQCMWFVKNPENYDVVVASNLFGDILSDLGAQLVGGLGFASAANIGDDYAVFEPTHGSAPKYAGQDKVNPTAMILATRLMLDWLGEKEMAARVLNAVKTIIREKKYRTYDMGGNTKTSEMAQAIADEL